MDVGIWLRGLGLERYEQAFRDGDVDPDVLPELTAEDLTNLGFTSVTAVCFVSLAPGRVLGGFC